MAGENQSSDGIALIGALARNREVVLQDEELALEAWLEVAEANTTGGSDFYTWLQGAARLLAKKGDYEKAFQILDRVDPAKLAGSWSVAMQLSRADVFTAAGKEDEAVALYREIVENPDAQRAMKERAEEALEELSEH
ncbi:MAG: hypothetical protein AAGF67_00705 [Verrucomicrobiota bacterium]